MISAVMLPLHIHLGICPYCGEKLGIVERLKQKSGRAYRCSKCGKLIDEKVIMY